MFKFDLPRGAVLIVNLPHGGTQRLVHMHDGRFVSDIPPIMFEGVKLREDAHEPAPASWDEGAADTVLAAEPELKSFDVESTAASVRYFAEQGQPRAKALMDRMKVAESMVAARDKSVLQAVDKPSIVIADASGNVTGAISAQLSRSGEVKIIAGD